MEATGKVKRGIGTEEKEKDKSWEERGPSAQIIYPKSSHTQVTF